MKFVRKFDRYITLFFFLIIIAVVATSYLTFKQVIDKYNKNQHQAIIPLFSIINSEIIRPLDTAYFMANDKFILDYVEKEEINEKVLFGYLDRLSKAYNMVTFIALEKHGYSLDSTNKKLSLKSEPLEWYNRLKIMDANQFADIGNAEDPHLYFDIKIFNDNAEFIGFIGVGIDLNHFFEIFNEYQQRFGFEIILVDQDNNVTLTSNQVMKTDSHHRADELTNISEFSWYKKIIDEKISVQASQSVHSVEDSGRIISQLPLKELNWKIFLISPPASQQNEYWQLFATRITLFIIILGLLYMLFQAVINYFKNSLLRDSKTDYLTQLPNRSYMNWKFKQIAKRYKNLCIVIADIDNFKNINDQFGHVVGDKVIKSIAEQLQNNLRQNDISCRWGGEEFVMLLPGTPANIAVEVAERIRESIANTPFNTGSTGHEFNTTASFGIFASTETNVELEKLIINADKALYSAKNKGRNRVEVFNS